jgi:hypothetical protein
MMMKKRMRPRLRQQCRIALRLGFLKHTDVVTNNALQAQGRYIMAPSSLA